MRQLTLARAGAGVAVLLLGSTAIALAQPEAMVTANDATHMATLAPAPDALIPTTGTGMAWFMLDPQDNTIAWTVEFTNVMPAAVGIYCEPEAAPGGAGAPAAPVDEAPDVNLLGEGAAPTSPLNGEEAGLDDALFDAIQNGLCHVALQEGTPLTTVVRGDIVEVPANVAPPAPAPAP